MEIDTAPRADQESDEDVECDNCGSVNSYVLYDHDKVCRECGHIAGSGERADDTRSEWQQWWDHRDDMYSGFTGKDRIKMVGGFGSAYR